ncbi:MAG: hypothetical protein RIS52_2264 [Pseudomonadota bacterium]
MAAIIVQFINMTDKLDNPPNRIREWRNRRGWTQGVLAEKIGVDTVHISNMERGNRETNLSRLRQLAAALGCSVADLLAPQDNPFGTDPDAPQILESLSCMGPEARKVFKGVAENLTSYQPAPSI